MFYFLSESYQATIEKVDIPEVSPDLSPRHKDIIDKVTLFCDNWENFNYDTSISALKDAEGQSKVLRNDLDTVLDDYFNHRSLVPLDIRNLDERFKKIFELLNCYIKYAENPNIKTKYTCSDSSDRLDRGSCISPTCLMSRESFQKSPRKMIEKAKYNDMVVTVKTWECESKAKHEEIRKHIDILSSLRSPSLLPVYGYVEYEDSSRIDSVEAFASKCLQDVISDERDTLGFDERMDILSSVAKGLAYLHKEGKVHGNIKPSNVFLYENRWVLGDLDIQSMDLPQDIVELKARDIQSFGCLINELCLSTIPESSSAGQKFLSFSQECMNGTLHAEDLIPHLYECCGAFYGIESDSLHFWINHFDGHQNMFIRQVERDSIINAIEKDGKHRNWLNQINNSHYKSERVISISDWKCFKNVF